MRKKYIIGEDRDNQFIYAGRLDRTKGIDRLLEAWKLFSNTGESIPKLIICGTGPEEQMCKEYIYKNNLQENVKVLGFIENSKVVRMMSKSLALILPTQLYEGFPMTVVEAFGYGTPVLGSSIGNVGSLVLNGTTGYTFNQKSPESILEAVKKLLVSQEMGIDLYKSTFEFYESNYTAEKNYKTLSNIYKCTVDI